MKRENKKLFLFLVCGIILLNLLIVFVSADENPSASDVAKKGAEAGKNLFNNLFGTTLTGGPIWELAVTKFLLMILVFTIIFGVSDVLIFDSSKGKTFLKILFSAIISYLSIIYLAPAEIFAALLGWGAMAITITSIIPIAVVLMISWRLASNPNPAKIFIQKIFLGIFAVYLAYRLAALIWVQPSNVWGFALPIYITVFVITLIMLIFNKTIQRFILTSKISGYLEISDTLNKEEALAEVIMLREKADALEKVGASDEAARLRSSATNLEKAAKSKFK